MVVAAAATAGLEVAATAGSVDVEVAAASEVAWGSEVAGAAAAGSVAAGTAAAGPMPSGSVISRPPAANPGEGAACAKSHDLAVTKATPPASLLARRTVLAQARPRSPRRPAFIAAHIDSPPVVTSAAHIDTPPSPRVDRLGGETWMNCRSERFHDLCDHSGEVFLKAAIASGFCAGCCGRALIW